MAKRRMKAVDAIKTAIEREKGAGQFYREASAIVVDPSGKTMLSWLAKEEARHLRGLQRQLKSLESTNRWLAWDGPSSPIQKAEFPSQSEASGEVNAHMTDEDVLRNAAIFEREAIEFYGQAEESTPDFGGKSMFHLLAQEEQGHLALLEAELGWIAEHCTYFTLSRFNTPT
jgi:rubrerythrin